MNKRRLIYVLTLAVAFLLVLNVLLGLIEIPKQQLPTSSLSTVQIERLFINTLDHFDIDDNWIEKTKRNLKNDSVSYIYNIKLPSTTPIPVILKDIQEEFRDEPVIINSVEANINGSSSLKITSGNILKLICNFKYDNSLIRSSSSIGLIITDGADLNEEELAKLLKMPFNFGVILPLEFESQKTAEKILDAKKDYFILLSDDSDEVNFELDDDLNLDAMNKHIEKIISMFNSRENFFIDNNSGLSNSSLNYLKERFGRRDRKINNLNSFVQLSSSTSDDLKSLVNFHFNKISGKENKVFIITFENLQLIVDELNNFLKKGNRIILPSQLLN